MAEQQSFPERLKAYRRIHGLSQGELARQWGYVHNTVSSWESGRRKPATQDIPRLAQLLAVSVEELVQSLDATNGKSQAQRPMHSINDEEVKATQERTLRAWGEIVGIYTNRTDFNRDHSYASYFDTAHEILAVGISLNAVALNFSREDIIKLVTEKQCSISLCFLNPRGSHCAEREQEESYEKGTLAVLTQLNIENMKATYRRIDQIDPDLAKNLSLNMYDASPKFNAYLVDNQFLTIQWYTQRRGEDTPIFVLKRNSTEGLFEFYASAVRFVLEHSTPIEV